MKDPILQAGVSNCLFIVPVRPVRRLLGFGYTSSSDEAVMLPATIVEDHYKVADGYKITLKPTIKGFETRSYYQCDLRHMIECGEVQFYVKGGLTAHHSSL